MATRTVRLDEEAEEALGEVRASTGLPISEVLKRGLRALQERVRAQAERRPYDIYKDLDLGPGGYAIGPSTNVSRGMKRALRKKLHR